MYIQEGLLAVMALLLPSNYNSNNNGYFFEWILIKDKLFITLASVTTFP